MAESGTRSSSSTPARCGTSSDDIVTAKTYKASECVGRLRPRTRSIALIQGTPTFVQDRYLAQHSIPVGSRTTFRS